MTKRACVRAAWPSSRRAGDGAQTAVLRRLRARSRVKPAELGARGPGRGASTSGALAADAHRAAAIRRWRARSLGGDARRSAADPAARRPASLPDAALVVIDEAHNLKSATSSVYGALLEVLDKRFDALLFLTATPFQLGRHELLHIVDFFRLSPAHGRSRRRSPGDAGTCGCDGRLRRRAGPLRRSWRDLDVARALACRSNALIAQRRADERRPARRRGRPTAFGSCRGRQGASSRRAMRPVPRALDARAATTREPAPRRYLPRARLRGFRSRWWTACSLRRCASPRDVHLVSAHQRVLVVGGAPTTPRSCETTDRPPSHSHGPLRRLGEAASARSTPEGRADRR